MAMLIPWSGGIDSSLILYDALYWWYGTKDVTWSVPGHHDNYIFKRKDGRPRTIAMECTQIDSNQEEMQTKSRDKLMRFFKRKKWDFDHTTIQIPTNDHVSISGSFPQPIMWLTQAALYVRDEEPLLMGWIRGDDATARWCEFRDLWRMLTNINGKRSELILPLHTYRKYHVVERAKDLGILSKCWYCENPKDNGRPCQQCDCCLTMIGTQAILDHQKKTLNTSDDKISRACQELSSLI